MGTIKQIDVKNQIYYFYNDMINIKKFDSNLFKIDQNHIKTLVFTTLDILQLKKLKIMTIFSVNPLYLITDHASGNIEEEVVNKYLVFHSMELHSTELHSADENKELPKKYINVFSGIRKKIKKISGNECDYEKDYMKVKFNFDNDLPLNKQMKFHNMVITIRSVFEEDGKLYQQVFLDDTLYE